jgi:hypothetical protein
MWICYVEHRQPNRPDIRNKKSKASGVATRLEVHEEQPQRFNNRELRALTIFLYFPPSPQPQPPAPRPDATLDRILQVNWSTAPAPPLLQATANSAAAHNLPPPLLVVDCWLPLHTSHRHKLLRGQAFEVEAGAPATRRVARHRRWTAQY